MSRHSPQSRKEPRAGFVRAGIAGAVLVLAACGPSSTPPASPSEPSPFTEAGAAFEEGDYEAAANAYRRALLVTEPGADIDREESLFRLSLMHTLPDSPLHDTGQAQLFLDAMLEEFPDSFWEAEIRSMLELQSVVADLQSTVVAMRSTIDRLEAERNAQAEFSAEQDARVDEVGQQLEAAESELETLRAIDRGRRPRQ
jgi:uncharacterized small protein (DUF1192 family)